MTATFRSARAECLSIYCVRASFDAVWYLCNVQSLSWSNTLDRLLGRWVKLWPAVRGDLAPFSSTLAVAGCLFFLPRNHLLTLLVAPFTVPLLLVLWPSSLSLPLSLSLSSLLSSSTRRTSFRQVRIMNA